MTRISSIPPTLQQRLAERGPASTPVVMHQRWEHLLFLHWRWDPIAVQRSLPPGLTVDTEGGSAWLGLVPLFMRKVHPRFIPAVPAVSDFLELNLRTYVYDAQGRPGLFFYSLDCNQPLVVEGARRLLHLRYEHSRMHATAEPGHHVRFEAARQGHTEKVDDFSYRANSGEGREARPETLEFFLIERYRLFADGGPTGHLSTLRVDHAPYRLLSVDAPRWGTTVMSLAGFETGGRPPDHITAANPMDVQVHMPELVQE
jgi:uncharacterized protein YqjF (DUF2071 family)